MTAAAEPMSAPEPMSESETVFRERYGPHVVQCSSPSRQTGDRCGQIAIPGGTVCKWHGGGNPNVKARANLRLLDAVEPSLARLVKIVSNPKSRDSDAIRAGNSLLDRAGVVRRTDVDPAAATALLVERLREIAEARAHPVVEGTVVPDGDITEPE